MTPLAGFSDQEILLAAIALNRGLMVVALAEGLEATQQAVALTEALGAAIDEELARREIDYRRMAGTLFDRILVALST